jgi:hypothetical protein
MYFICSLALQSSETDTMSTLLEYNTDYPMNALLKMVDKSRMYEGLCLHVEL